VPRVAYLSASSAASATWGVEAFRQGLRELGYVEGRNITIEYWWADGQFDRLPALAADLARFAVEFGLMIPPSLAAAGGPRDPMSRRWLPNTTFDRTAGVRLPRAGQTWAFGRRPNLLDRRSRDLRDATG
jgi:hypothetical protein